MFLFKSNFFNLDSQSSNNKYAFNGMLYISTLIQLIDKSFFRLCLLFLA